MTISALQETPYTDNFTACKYTHMQIDFTATITQLARIETVFGPLPHIRIWCLIPDHPEDCVCVSCDLPLHADSVLRLCLV
jgi:hypothetical protein